MSRSSSVLQSRISRTPSFCWPYCTFTTTPGLHTELAQARSLAARFVPPAQAIPVGLLMSLITVAAYGFDEFQITGQVVACRCVS